jgi:hypothetical protein
LEAFKQLPQEQRQPALEKPRTPSPVQAHPKPPPGTLLVRVYASYLERDAQGALARKPSFDDIGFRSATSRFEQSVTAVDTMWLPGARLTKLLPKDPKPGDSFLLSAGIGQPMQYHLGDLMYGQVAGTVEGTLKVEKVSEKSIEVRLDARMKRAAGENDPVALDFRMLGFLTYDREKDFWTRFDAVALGDVTGGMDVGGTGHVGIPDRLVGISFERVTGERPIDLSPPIQITTPFRGDGTYNYEQYWGADD